MKNVLFLIIFSLLTVHVWAQENGNRDAKNQIVRGPYETNRFFDNWFIGIGGGVNIYEGECNSKASFGERLAPAIDFTVGKWITPSVGVRAQYSGLQAKGLTGFRSKYSRARDGKYFKERFGVMNLHADAMWNISNALSGYKETRTWNVIPFVGFGWARSYGKDQYKNEFAPSIGLVNNFRLGKIVDLTLEARQMFVNQRFDGVAGGSKGEGMTSVTVGFSFKLGKSGFKRVQKAAPADYTPYLNKISALEGDKAALDTKAKQLEKELAEARNQKPEADAVNKETEISTSPVALFFGLGKTTLEKKELVNLGFFVENAMKKDKNKTFTLIGCADKATGSAEVNRRISEQRMQYVYDILVKKYGVSPDRLVKKSEGDSNNRFDEPELNRIVIIQ